MNAAFFLSLIALMSQAVALVWCLRTAKGSNYTVTWIAFTSAMGGLLIVRIIELYLTLSGTGPDILWLASSAILSMLLAVGFVRLYPAAKHLRSAQRNSLHLNALLEDASEIAGMGYWIGGYEGAGYDLVSPGFAKIHGTTVEDFMKTAEDKDADIKRWVHPDDIPYIIKRYDEWDDHNKEVDITYRIIRTDGAVRYVRDMARWVRKDKGELVQVGTLRDITDYKEAEEKLNAAMRKAETADHAKTMFLAVMSHELRTPLNAIIGYAQMLQSSVTVTADKKLDYAETIEEAGQHLLGIIADILDTARIELGEIDLKEEWYDPHNLMKSAVRIAKVQSKEGPANIRFDLMEQAVELRADERLVRQVLVNLASNALKFTPGNGTITLGLHVTDQNELTFQVTDTGCGIAEADIEKVLAPFGKVGNDANITNGGVGLGLPITKGLVERHGGTFNLQSNLGAGTTVTVTFPADRVRLATAKPANSP